MFSSITKHPKIYPEPPTEFRLSKSWYRHLGIHRITPSGVTDIKKKEFILIVKNRLTAQTTPKKIPLRIFTYS